MVELSPIVFVDGKLLKEDVEYKLEKIDWDKSVKITLKTERGLIIRFTPSKIMGGIPRLEINGDQIDFNKYKIHSYILEKKPGVRITIQGAPIKNIILVPRVMTNEEFKKQARKEELRKYQKEHNWIL